MGGAGVVYLSRIPPFLGPTELRARLSKLGDVNRMYLKEEGDEARKKRVKAGGRRRKNFTCGWVEFVKRKDAETAAVLLNSRPMGGKKKSSYHDDLWNIRYLKGFAWTDLTEQMAYERRTKEQRVAVEIAQARRERDFYIEKVDQAKAIEGMVERARKKRKDEGDDSVMPKRVRHFRQRTAEEKPVPRESSQDEFVDKSGQPTVGQDVPDDILRMIFSKGS